MSIVFFAGFAGLMGRRWAGPCFVIAVLNLLPRLFGGGHWLSDIVVGSGVIGLLVAPCLLFTPAVEGLDRVLARLAPRGD